MQGKKQPKEGEIPDKLEILLEPIWQRLEEWTWINSKMRSLQLSECLVSHTKASNKCYRAKKNISKKVNYLGIYGG